MSRVAIPPCVLSFSLLAALLITVPVAADTQDYFPSTQTIVKGTVGGSFPTDIESSNDVYVTPTEADQAAAPTDLSPDSEVLTKAVSVSGTLADENSDNGVFRTVREADQSSITDLTADSQILTKGTQPAGTFPTDVNSDNGVTVTYREANQGVTSTIDFDAKVESVRTGTTDPHTWTHIPVGTPRAIIVSSIHGVTATDHVLSCMYGGVSMTKSVTASDTATEPGRSDLWFVGASIPTGSQTVSCDLDSATTDDIQFISISYTAAADVEVIDTDSASENQPNPSRTLQFNGRQALAIMALYWGGAAPPVASACSGTSACTLVDNHDLGAFVATVDRQSTRGSTDQTMGYTSANDDVAFVTLAISEIGSALDYELEIRYAWTTETCADTRRLTVNAWHTTTEDILVQVLDSTETTYTTRLTVTATADGTTLTYDLIADEWDSGDPNLRFLGSSEAGDSTQTDLLADYVVVRCIPAADFELEYRVGWTSETCTDTRRLTINSFRADGDMENVDVQVVDSTESTWTTRLTVTATADGTTQTYDLTADEWDAGAPDIRFLGTTESGDTFEGDFSIDLAIVRCTPAPLYEVEVQYGWTGVDTTGDSWTLIIECSRTTNPENGPIQVLTPPSSWTTRYTCSADVDTTYDTYDLTTAELASGSPTIRIVDSGPDASQSSWSLDLVKIQRTFTSEGPPEPPPDPGGGSEHLGVDLNGGIVTGGVQTSPTGPRTSPAPRESFASAPDTSGTCPGPYWHRGPAGNAWTHDAGNQEMSFSASLGVLSDAGFFSHGGGAGATCDAGPYGDETDLAMSARFRVTTLPTLTNLYLGFHDTVSGSGFSTILGPAIDVQNGGWSACVVVDGGGFDCSSLQTYSTGAYHSVEIRWFASNRTALVQVDDVQQTFVEPGGGSLFGFPTGAIGTVMMVRNRDLTNPQTIDVDVDDISVPRIRDGYWRSFDIQTPNVIALDLRWFLSPDTNGDGSRIGNRMFGNSSDQVTNYWRLDTTISTGSTRHLTAADSTVGSLTAIGGTWTFETRLAHDDGLTLRGTQLEELTVTYEVLDAGAPSPPEQPPFGIPQLQILAPIVPVVAPLCNVWLVLLVFGVLAVALYVRHTKRSGSQPP